MFEKCQYACDADRFEEILFEIFEGGYSQRLHLVVVTVATPSTFHLDALTSENAADEIAGLGAQ